MTDRAEGLRPCPFCGSEAELGERMAPCVLCTYCEAVVMMDTQERAIAAWNDRAEKEPSEPSKRCSHGVWRGARCEQCVEQSEAEQPPTGPQGAAPELQRWTPKLNMHGPYDGEACMAKLASGRWCRYADASKVISQARQTGEYWKAEHNAANKRIAELEARAGAAPDALLDKLRAWKELTDDLIAWELPEACCACRQRGCQWQRPELGCTDARPARNRSAREIRLRNRRCCAPCDV